MTTINIDETLTFRLSIYQHTNGLSSWAEAVSHLLDMAETPPPSNASKHTPIPQQSSGRLEITYLIPGVEGDVGEQRFKEALLQHKNAYVRIHYADGRISEKLWHAFNITETSTIRGNLASGYLRSWRIKGICKAEISINPFPEDTL